MELKLIKEVTITAVTFKIKYDSNTGGGSFSFRDREIIIGTIHLKNDPTSVFNIILHEISEALHCCLKTRYDDDSAGDNYKFFMDHKEFENHTMLLAQLISKFIK